MGEGFGKQTPYRAVPVEEQDSDAPPWGDREPQSHATVKHSLPVVENHDKTSPQPLNLWVEKALRLVLDFVVAVIALLFAIFGVWVFQADGDPADSGSTGAKLFKASQYVRNSDMILLVLRHSLH
jgi:hypothetical protein